LTLLFIFLWCIILQAGILLIFLNTPWGDQAFKKSLVGFFSAGAGLPRGPENQYAKSYTSFSSRFRFNEGRAFKNKRVAYFSEGASLPRWQWDEEPTLWSSRAPLKDEWGEQTGNYCYGARYYDPKISVWLSVDPILKHHESPYSFTSNNPIMLIDPDGRDTILYDQKGNERVVSAKGEDVHLLNHNEGNISLNGNNYYQGLSRESFFGDRQDADQGVFTDLDKSFDKNGDWKSYALVRDYKNENHTVGDFKNESKTGQYYDYKERVLNKSANPKKAYLFNGVILNSNEMGNLLWGATAASFGFGSFLAQSAGEIFTQIDEGKSDEAGEQRAIEAGIYNWNKWHKK
jgi:RHS repeat-associated protein